MRICPKCGHSELIWKHLQHARFTDYCHIGELKDFFPELAKKVLAAYVEKIIYCDDLYNYRYVKAGFVHRIWKADACLPNSMKEPDMEKPKNRFEAIKFKRVAPIPPIFVATMRTLTKGKEELLDKEFGKHKWPHWIRYDNSGFCYPRLEDLQKIADIFGEDPPIHYIKSVQQNL